MTATELRAILKRYEHEARTQSLTTPRYRMAYTEWGSGEPLIIIHGLNDIPRSFAPFMSHLSYRFRCIAVALPEGSHDGAKLHHYRHRHYTEDLITLFDELNLDTVTLLGSSFGSTIALRTAIGHPHRISNVILQGGFARRPLKLSERFLARLGQSWPWRMGQLPVRPRIMRRLEGPAFVNAPAMIDFLLANSAVSSIRAVTHRARILTTLDLRPQLPKLKQPLLMIGGDTDRIVPRHYEAEVESLVPHVRRIEFSNCGHYPQYTHSKEMAETIRRFLDSGRLLSLQ